MLSQKDQLTELVRELEAREHIFATDPILITEKLKSENGDSHEKLNRRAERIDSNGKLANTLFKIDTRIKAIILGLSLAWTASGFLGLFALLNANVVNFFYVLVCLLGFHTLMLLGWIVFTIISDRNKPTMFASLVSPSHLIRGKDDITTSAVALYEKQLQHAGMRWYLGKISHQLWLATLCGMTLALIMLFMVRDFSFSWESTLLGVDTVAMLVSWLAWLPDLVGFATPSPEQVLQSQQFASEQLNTSSSDMPDKIISSYEWAMLLIGSLIMYGIVPRTILWLLCSVLFHSKKMHLDLKQPYYQKILAFWSREVMDEDDFKEQVTPVAPKARLTDGDKLAVLLEYRHEKAVWYPSDKLDSHGNTIDNYGVVDDRDDIDTLCEYLQDKDVQVIVGVQASALPDRGTMRKLDKIAKYAKQGMIVQLLDTSADSNAVTTEDSQQANRIKQWQQALAERNIGLLTD